MNRIGVPNIGMGREPVFKHGFELLHQYSLGAFALLFLLVALSGIKVSAAYWSAHISLPALSSTAVHIPARPLHGPNMALAADQLNDNLARITSQPLSLTIGTQTVPVSPESIRSWLQIVTDKGQRVSYIHVKDTAIAASLAQIAAPALKAPVNQVSITRPDGSTSVIATGKNGIGLGDTSIASKQITQDLLGAKGMQLTLPTQTQPFQAVTAAAFDKLIEVNVVTKQMYLYDKGQLTRSYPISAGAPITPTPIGQYKIYQKLAVQDMKGLNPNGSKYFQPHVHWINYFLPGGYAVHGNYWRPLSAFGATNTSHGCVSLPDDQAQGVYNWAPIGTTVITHV